MGVGWSKKGAPTESIPDDGVKRDGLRVSERERKRERTRERQSDRETERMRERYGERDDN